MIFVEPLCPEAAPRQASLGLPLPALPGLCVPLMGQITSREPRLPTESVGRRRKRSALGDQDEKDKGATNGQGRAHHVQGFSSPLRGAGPGWTQHEHSLK